jgi:hypothetical protein
LGQWCVVDALEELDEDEDAFAVGLDVAAWATIALPPTKAPEMVRATRALLMRFRMVAHLLPALVTRQ